MRRLLLLGLLCAAAPAWAQDAPLTTPTRDVDVTYRTVSGSQPLEQRSRFHAADGKRRLDTPTPGFYMIIDVRAHTMAMVSDPDRGVVDMSLPAAMGPGGFAPGQGFTRVGADTVLGLPCTEWETSDSGGRKVQACFTADGVVLRVRSAAAVLVQAVRISYAALDPALFTVPAGYSHRRAP
jgi:hypothetical protein